MDCEPLVDLLPDQAPEAAQDVALAELQVRVALPPVLTALGPTLKLTVGAAPVTETTCDCVAVPPGPVHVSVYVVVAKIFSATTDPLTAPLLPDQPPKEVQAVAWVVDQESLGRTPL